MLPIEGIGEARGEGTFGEVESGIESEVLRVISRGSALYTYFVYINIYINIYIYIYIWVMTGITHEMVVIQLQDGR